MSSDHRTAPVARPPWFTVLGVRVHLLTSGELTMQVAAAIARRQRLIVANHNLHSVHLFHQRASMRRFFDVADIVHVDGMSLIALAKLAGVPAGRRHRVSYLDWIDELFDAASRERWRVFFLGGAPAVGPAAASVLQRRYPGLAFDTHHGFFDTAAEAEVLERIGTFRPNLLFVGMGMPRQEEWIARNAARLDGVTVLPCGACFDYIAGVVATPPRWTGQLGIEWLFRLCCDPSRLWRRYLVEPLQLLAWLLTRTGRDSRPRAT